MKFIKFFQFFLDLLSEYGDGLILLPAMTLATFVVVYIVYRVTGRRKFYKYLPGIILSGLGLFFLYLGLVNLTERSGLDRIWDFCIYFVAGFNGLLFAWILGIYNKRKKKTDDFPEEIIEDIPEESYVEEMPADDADRFGETRAVPKINEAQIENAEETRAIYLDEIERLEKKKHGEIAFEEETDQEDDNPEDDFVLPETERVTKDWQIWRKKK